MGHTVSRMTPGRPGVIFLLCLLSFPLVARAGLFDGDTQQQMADLHAQQDLLAKQQQTLDERITRMESSLQGYPDMVLRMESLNQEMAELRGKLDEQTKHINDVDKHVHELYLDLDTRLKALEGPAKPADGSPAATSSPSSGDNGKQASAAGNAKAGSSGEGSPYDDALASFSAGKYEASLKKFQAFVKDHPDDTKVPNALYWVGMNELLLKNYKAARNTNQDIYKKYPDSSKAPDALLNLASAWAGLGDMGKSKAALKLLIKEYPDSSAATKARARLK